MKFWNYVKRIFWKSLPFLWGLFLILLGQIPTSFMPYYHQSFPFVVGLIFYFSIFNPKVLNVFLVFLLGLIMDMVTSLPLGFNAFGFVFVYFMVSLFHSYLLNMVFPQLLFVFCVLFLCTDIIWAFTFFLISGTWVSTGFWFVQYIFVALSYPLFCRLYGRLNRKILEVS